ncbi:MAG: 50S ribosomal protein L23 [Thermaerobacter sp.]|nr:50S ribosomal protein L23 [Bacillota bacterium]REJ38371.1 MAG: 50S ribosomal protein L23 [Bacillota bacterium]
MTSPHDVILRPVITEKSMQQMAQGKYTFVVSRRATKPEIRRAVEELFDVEVEKVNTMTVRGKTRRLGRFSGRRPDWKKAVVTLKEGQRIRKFFDELG